MIHLCLFGVSAGLEVRRMALGEGTTPRFEDSWIEISTRDVSFEGEVEVLRVSRRQLADQLLTWVGVYRPAREIHLNRSGGYYGAGIWMVDCALPGRRVREVLLSLADQLRDAALSNGRFIRPIGGLDLSGFKLSLPPESLLSECTPLHATSGVCPSEPAQAILTDTRSINAILDWAQRSRTAEFFGSVLVAPPDRVLQSDTVVSKRNKTFSSIPAAIEFAYAERVKMSEQSRQLADQYQAELDFLKRQAEEQRRSSQQQITQLEQQKHQLRRELAQIRPRPLRPPIDAESKPWFTRWIIRSWRLLATATVVVIVVAIAIPRIHDAWKGESAVKTETVAEQTRLHGESTKNDNKQPEAVLTSAYPANSEDTQPVATAPTELRSAEPADDTEPSEASVVKTVDVTNPSEQRDPDLEGLNQACASYDLEFLPLNFEITDKNGELTLASKAIKGSEGGQLKRHEINKEIEERCKIDDVTGECRRRISEANLSFTEPDGMSGSFFLPKTCLDGPLQSLDYLKISNGNVQPPR